MCPGHGSSFDALLWCFTYSQCFFIPALQTLNVDFMCHVFIPVPVPFDMVPHQDISSSIALDCYVMLIPIQCP